MELCDYSVGALVVILGVNRWTLSRFNWVVEVDFDRYGRFGDRGFLKMCAGVASGSATTLFMLNFIHPLSSWPSFGGLLFIVIFCNFMLGLISGVVFIDRMTKDLEKH